MGEERTRAAQAARAAHARRTGCDWSPRRSYSCIASRTHDKTCSQRDIGTADLDDSASTDLDAEPVLEVPHATK
jgi:hypothetical protein